MRQMRRAHARAAAWAGRRRSRTSTCSSPPTSRPSSTAPSWEWTAACCFERRRLARPPPGLGAGGVRGSRWPRARLLAASSDQPLLYRHQYHYFTNGLSHRAAPASARLRARAATSGASGTALDDRAALLRVRGRGVPALRPAPGCRCGCVQCVLGALTAVAVAASAARWPGPRGAWAGVAYAVYASAVEMPSWTLTENLHTCRSSLAGMAADSRPRSAQPGLALPALGRPAARASAALARSVSVGLPARARGRGAGGTRRSARAAGAPPLPDRRCAPPR